MVLVAYYILSSLFTRVVNIVLWENINKASSQYQKYVGSLGKISFKESNFRNFKKRHFANTPLSSDPISKPNFCL